MYADAAPVYDAELFNINGRILVVIEQATQVINRFVLGECGVGGRRNEKEQAEDSLHLSLHIRLHFPATQGLFEADWKRTAAG